MNKQKIIVIVGPTASGKTSLSIKLAKDFNGEVISADSRQVYTGLDIGTEKVTPEEMDGVPHHVLDVVTPESVYTANDFARDAQEAIANITQRQHVPIIAGGTFFYIDMLLGNTSTPSVAPNPALRAELETKSVESLYNSLRELDPRRAADIDPYNKRRIMRALEIVAAIGAVPETTSADCPYDVLKLGIQTDKTALRARIRARAKDALTKGLVEETQQLLADGITRERLCEIGLEYRVVMEYIDGELSDDALIQKLEEKNWQYAKRQLTWLKRDHTIQWCKPEAYDMIHATVTKWLE